MSEVPAPRGLAAAGEQPNKTVRLLQISDPPGFVKLLRDFLPPPSGLPPPHRGTIAATLFLGSSFTSSSSSLKA
eukprot:4214155-Pyramimonas_sp.AAC.1